MERIAEVRKGENLLFSPISSDFQLASTRSLRGETVESARWKSSASRVGSQSFSLNEN